MKFSSIKTLLCKIAPTAEFIKENSINNKQNPQQASKSCELHVSMRIGARDISPNTRTAACIRFFLINTFFMWWWYKNLCVAETVKIVTSKRVVKDVEILFFSTFHIHEQERTFNYLVFRSSTLNLMPCAMLPPPLAPRGWVWVIGDFLSTSWWATIIAIFHSYKEATISEKILSLADKKMKKCACDFSPFLISPFSHSRTHIW